MGILRTDKISGLETPRAVTGSVFFDGNDHLEIGASGDFNFLHNALSDWTAEFWVKTGSATRQFAFGTGASSAQHGFSLVVMSTDDNQADGTGVYAQFGRGSAGNYRYWGSNEGLTVDTWHHVAAVFKSSDKTLTLYIDGREVDSGTGTANGTFATTDYSTSNHSFSFVVAENQHGDTYLTGYISNLRVVSGRRLYTENFTPPVHELEPIDGTRILCCNNPDSVTAFSNAGIGTVRTVTTGGDPSVGTASTEFPGLTRDFTFGTEFRGVTTFDTQGYFVPPSGTTTERFPDFGAVDAASARGVFTGGDSNVIDYITISTTGDAQDFGDLTYTVIAPAGLSNNTRALFGGGYNPSRINTISFITFSSTGNSSDFGDMLSSTRDRGGLANSTRGLFFGGFASPGANINAIDYVTIVSSGNSVDFGDMYAAVEGASGCSSPIRGIIAGGSGPNTNSIGYVSIPTTGNTQDFGDMQTDRWTFSAISNSTRGLFAGGRTDSTASGVDTIDFITIATAGNAQDFGDLTVARSGCNDGSVSSSTRGVIAGGYNPSSVDTIDYVEILTTGNAVDFGNLSSAKNRLGSASNGHGGLG